MSETKLDRRGFLAGAAGVTGVALAVGAWKPVFAMERESAIAPRDLVPAVQRVGHIQLTLGESTAGFISSAEGGNATGDVVVEKLGPDFVARKHLAGVKYEDVTITAGTGMSKAFYGWIKGAFSGQPVAMSGSIAGANENFKLFTKTDFSRAVITEVGFPALDAASKDVAKMTIKFQPELTRRSATTGSLVPPGPNVRNDKWLVSNFKLTLNDVNTKFVTSIDSLNIKWDFATQETDIGASRPQLVKIDIPNLKLRVVESQSKDFFLWHEDFVIKGNNGPDNEKRGSLSFLSSDLKTELFRLDLSGVGIFALDPDALTLNSTSVRHVTAQLYCDQMVFNFKL